MSKTQLWKSQKEGYQESLNYMKGRMEGNITSFRTPWVKFNDATTDGLEWHSTTVIGGRPGAGKTLAQDQIIREGFKLNPAENFRVLKFEFEMMARTSAIRDYSSLLGKSYKYLCSADGKLSKEDLKSCYEYAKTIIGQPVDVVDTPVTVNEFGEIIEKYMEAHAIMIGGKKVYTHTVITVDHSLLFERAPFEKDPMDMLYNLGKKLTYLKKKYPIAFIILSQLNRSVDSPERSEDGKYGNYILDSDIFGADALLQHADTLVGLNRPALKQIKFYGPDRYIIENDQTLVMHFLKARNGDTRMSFFKAEFSKMRIVEMATPAQQTRKAKI